MSNIIDKIQLSGVTYDIGGGGSSYSAGTGIDITNDVISVTGKVDTTTYNTYTAATDTALNNKADTSAVTAVQDSLSGYVYTADLGKQDIYGKKTFIGTKRLNFTQAKSSDKLGFTLYDARDEQGYAKEFAAFELNPTGITENSVTHPLLTLNHYRNDSGRDVQTYIGYRQYDQPHSAAYHLLAPLPENAKTPFNLTKTFQNYYFPLGFKNGSTMIKADNAGVVNLSSEFGGKVDASDFNTYSGTVDTALSGKQDTLVSGTNIKTINNESILGSGNIDIQGGGGEVSSAITSGDTNAVAGGAVFDAVVYSGNTYNTELTFDNDGYAENWVVGQSAITIDVSGYTSDTRAYYDFEDSNGVNLGSASIYKMISTWWTSWNNDAINCTITTDGNTATTATITDIPSGTVKLKRTNENNPPKAIISGDTPQTWIKDALDEHRDNTTIHITSAERTYWNNKSNFSGSYNDLADKPIPDSALNVASRNSVQNQALYSELRIDDGSGETQTTLIFEGRYSTNYPNGCTKIKVEVVGSNNSSTFIFYDIDNQSLGNVIINNNQWEGITVDTSNFQGASYETSGTTVIISYPTVTNVVKIQLLSGDYVYKAITTSTTPLKDQVVANTTALGGLSLIKLTQAEYDALATKDNNTLYVIVG